MELTRANVQIQPTPFKSVKEEMAPMATSGTQLTFEKEQPKEKESMSIEELLEKYMKKQDNMTTMSFEGQYENFPSTLGVNTTSQVQFMELTRANVQIQPTPIKSVKEEMAPMATSDTQLTFEKEQPKEEESMSIEELLAKYMKEQDNITTMSFEGQYENFPSTLGVNTEEENWS